jgi:hypothetical protein
MAWPGSEDKLGFGMWLVLAFLAIGSAYTVYSIFISPSERTIYAREFRKERRQRATALPDAFQEQYLMNCEQELRKRLGLN